MTPALAPLDHFENLLLSLLSESEQTRVTRARLEEMFLEMGIAWVALRDALDPILARGAKNGD